MLACLPGWCCAEEHLSVPLALRQRRLQTKIQKEGRCEEDQPSRAHRKLRVHRKRINKRYAARERCASIPTSTPLHLATSIANTISVMFAYDFALVERVANR